MLKHSSMPLAPHPMPGGIEEEATSDDGGRRRPEKKPAAVALSRLGGKKGGKASAEKLTAEQRTEIGRSVALTRWSKREQQS